MEAPICVLLVLCAAEWTATALPDRPTETSVGCGYEACPAVEKNMLNVHLIPHSHNDLGWVKTVDQYFNGSFPNVVGILNSVVEALLRDPKRRFVYAEMAYLSRWWALQSAGRRREVRDLVNQGRLEIVGGGWSQNDEAVTHYQSIIDQMTWGLRFLNDTFGQCGRPRAGWQIDPFGHSREMASLFAQMGYDGLFVGRIPFDDYTNRSYPKELEMVWVANSTEGEPAELFTHVLFNGYSPPADFCFDVLCRHSGELNKYGELHVELFLEEVTRQSEKYATNNILLTMGGDFHYGDAEKWFRNMDYIVRHTKKLQAQGSPINVMYSTPNCYLKAVNDDGRQRSTWSTKVDDFFPYVDAPHVYWTGYYTSRPTIKYFERLSNNLLQVCKQLFALSNLRPEKEIELDSLRDAMGIMQHHDAITGTSKQEVVNDYVRLLNEAAERCNSIIHTAISKFIPYNPIDIPPVMETCLELNTSQCRPSEESKNFVVTIYNPLARVVSPYIRIPVSGTFYVIQDAKGNHILHQLVPIPKTVQKIPGRFSSARYEIVFKAVNLKPLGFNSYFISEQNVDEDCDTFISEESRRLDDFGYKNYYYKSNRRGDLKILKIRNVPFKLQLSYAAYTSRFQDNGQNAGAYVLRPDENKMKHLDSASSFTVTGPVVTERHEIFNDWLSQVVRIYDGEEHMEVEWMVGPLPESYRFSNDIVLKYRTGFDSQGIFYTDSNGRGLLQRIRKNQSSGHFSAEDRIPSNYYPVTNRIVLRDYKKQRELCILTDRAEGGSSLQDGELELMLHRRTAKDDMKGMDEPLNEKSHGEGLTVRGKHYVIAGHLGNNITLYEKKLALLRTMSPWLIFSRADTYSYETWSKKYKMELEGLQKPLPDNVHLLTLEPWKENSLLLRLEHILQKGEDPKLSKSVTVSLKGLFVPFEITSAKETTISANQRTSDVTRLKWKTRNTKEYTRSRPCKYSEDTNIITIKPMQICTLVIEVMLARKEK